MTELWRALRDPRVSTALTLSAVVLAGLGLVLLGWRGAAATLLVPFQLPYVVSGGVAGIALTGAGLGLLVAHVNRAEAAAERQQVAEIQRGVLALLAHAPEARRRAGR